MGGGGVKKAGASDANERNAPGSAR